MKQLLSASIIVITLLLLANPVSAQTTPTPLANRADQAKTRLCQARQDAIQNRMARLVKLAENMESKFTSIADRVQEYYLGSGKTVANYDTLVADIQTKKGLVDESLTKTQTDLEGFSCEADNPRGLLTQFRLDVQATKTALKNYRTSIKNLIVAVRSATGAANRAKPTTEAVTQ